MYVHAGDNKRKGWEKRETNKWFRHPEYVNPSIPPVLGSNQQQIALVQSVHDIALVKLEKPFTRHLTDGSVYRINTICLPERRQTNDRPENVSFYGFGQISENTYGDNLRRGTGVLRPESQCSNGKMFCADTIGRASKTCSV